MIPDRVKAVLDAHGLKALEFEEGSTPTAESAAAKIGVQVGQIAKSLLFKGGSGKVAMIVCAGDKKISSGKIKRLCGEKMSMTSAEDTYAYTGFWPGGVCPFGVEGIPVYIDESLSVWDTVYPAAGTNSTGVPMTFRQLLSISGGATCSVASDPGGNQAGE